MGNVHLCDYIICSPSWSDERCVRCIHEQYENLIEETDVYDYSDDYFYSDDEEDFYPTDFY